MSKEALKLALEALEETVYWRTTGIGRPPEQTAMNAITALREVLAALPAQQAPDTHQLFIDSLPTGCDDKMFEQIHHWARQSYQRHKMSVRGQSITAADAPDIHIIWATLRWAKENADPQPSKSWVGLTDFERDQLWYRYSYKDLMIAIEDKLKEKNT